MGLDYDGLAGVEICRHHREAIDDHRMASLGLSPVLEMDDSAWHAGAALRGELRQLICTMSCDNPRWGAPKIHGELLKLGIDIAPSQTWKLFLDNYAEKHVIDRLLHSTDDPI